MEGEEETIGQIVLEFYSNMFATTHPSSINEDFHLIERGLLDKQILELKAFSSSEEVSIALKQMPLCKAPGSDGMSARFYQQHWQIVRSEVASFFLDISILNSADIPVGLNHTFVCLIPKVKEPVSMKDLRPISLCNILYKLISKVLVNQLKSVLSS